MAGKLIMPYFLGQFAISVWNFGLMIGGKTGPMLYEHLLHKNMSCLIWLNAGVTLTGIFLVSLLPKTLVDKSEGK